MADCTTPMYTKSIISQKLKVAQKKTHELKNNSQSNPHISCGFFQYFFWPVNFWSIVNTISHNSKKKNRKIEFSFDSALCTSFMKIGAKLRGGGGLHILTSDRPNLFFILFRTLRNNFDQKVETALSELGEGLRLHLLN